MVLAGGEGKRLMPLSRDRAKPAVPFGGKFRLIDFALSNLTNGGYRKIVVLTQYKSHSLDVHISTTWRLSTLLGLYVTTVPAQMRRGPTWFQGSADAIFQNQNLIDDEDPDYIFVFGADHIYRFDPQQLLDHHIATGAGVTVAGIRAPIEDAYQFGVIEKGESTKIEAFREKPSDPKPLPDDPTQVLASMGNYVFSRSVLEEVVRTDADDPSSGRDVGGDIIPMLVESGDAHVYDYSENVIPGDRQDQQHYWRDVGTIDSFHAAHMDLVAPEPAFSLYNYEWPIYTRERNLPPAKFVRDGDQACDIYNALVSEGSIVSGGTVHNSVLSPRVRVESGAVVENSILFDDVVVHSGAHLRNVIMDKNIEVPSGFQVGLDHEADAAHYDRSAGGVVTFGKGHTFD